MTEETCKQPIGMTDAQKEAIKKKWEQNPCGYINDFDGFLLTVQPTFGCDGAVTVHWCGMWLCVETDGYTHT